MMNAKIVVRLLLEKSEIDAAVCALLYEMRVGGEIVCFGVLQYK